MLEEMLEMSNFSGAGLPKKSGNGTLQHVLNVAEGIPSPDMNLCLVKTMLFGGCLCFIFLSCVLLWTKVVAN